MKKYVVTTEDFTMSHADMKKFDSPQAFVNSLCTFFPERVAEFKDEASATAYAESIADKDPSYLRRDRYDKSDFDFKYIEVDEIEEAEDGLEEYIAEWGYCPSYFPPTADIAEGMTVAQMRNYFDNIEVDTVELEDEDSITLFSGKLADIPSELDDKKIYISYYENCCLYLTLKD